MHVPKAQDPVALIHELVKVLNLYTNTGAGLQENYNSLLEKFGEYERVAKATMKTMKKVEEDYKSLRVRYKEAKCEIETLNGELTEAYSKIKFLELEVVQANAKVERVSTKKLDDVLSHILFQ